METLAYIAIVLAIIVIGIGLSRHLDNKYSFAVFSPTSVGATFAAAVTWVLAVALYEPGSAQELWVEVAAGAFVLFAGVVLPIWLLVKNIRETNFFWGLLAFVYQLLAVATVVVLLLLLILRLTDKN